jgi:hypothetical protein
MGQNTTFVTFDEARTRLNIDETKLKRLVSEGAFRAFHEGGQMKFRKKDIENFSPQNHEAELEEAKKGCPDYIKKAKPSEKDSVDDGSDKAPPRATGCAVLLGAIVIAIAGGVAFALS